MHNIDTHLSDEQLSTFLDDRLEDAEREHANLHLQSCDDCSQSLDELRFMVRTLRALPPLSLPRSFLIVEPPKAGFWARLLGTGALLQGLAAVAAGLFVILFSADMMSMASANRFVAIPPAPEPRAITTSQKPQPTATLPYAAPAAGRAESQAAPPPQAAPAAPASAAGVQADTAVVQRAPQATETAKLEALNTTNGSATAAGALPRLSETTLATGLVAVLLIISVVVRTVRRT